MDGNGGNGNAANVACRYMTGSACQSKGEQLENQVQQQELNDWLAFNDAMQRAFDPCHGNDRCQIQNTLATVSGVKGCFKEANPVDCAGLIPIGKVLKGGEFAWDGVRLLRMGHRIEEYAHADEIAAQIADGHGWKRHLKKGDLPVGVTTKAQYAGVIHDTIMNGDIRKLQNGRFAFWRNGSIVIVDPGADDFGTAFVPKDGLDYFLGKTTESAEMTSWLGGCNAV